MDELVSVQSFESATSTNSITPAGEIEQEILYAIDSLFASKTFQKAPARCAGAFFTQISHVALVDDVEHTARCEAQRRDDGQRHERKRHEGVDPARDAEGKGLLLGILQRFVDLDERRFAHDARDLELDLTEHLTAVHHDDAAAELDDAVDRRSHILFVRTDDDDVVAVMRDGRCHRAGLEAVALDVADADVVRVLVALDDGDL